MGDALPPRDDLGPLIDELRDIRRQLRELQKPTGSQYASTTATVGATVDYLASLVKVSVGTASYNSGTIPNDGVTRWYTNPTPLDVVVAVKTGVCTVTVEAGEASMTGEYVQAFCGFAVKDANGVIVPGYGLGAITGRLYTANLRLGARIATPSKPVTITNPVANPGPYTISGFFGAWSSTLNTTASSIQFNDLAMTVEVIGSGVS